MSADDINGNVAFLQATKFESRDTDAAVELQITNLDRAIPPSQLRDVLLEMFRDVIPVKELSISFLSDGKPQAIVKVVDEQTAKLAIFSLHRKKLGHKRIYLAPRIRSTLGSLKSKVASILLSIPSEKIHLIKFRELYEQRFNCSVRVTDLYKMTDLLSIYDDASGRILQLKPDLPNKLPGLDMFYCERHSNKGQGLSDTARDSFLLVEIPLPELNKQISNLLQEHGGRIPLASLTDCYQFMFGKVEASAQAVPLLHLVTCLKGVKIVVEESGMKSLLDCATFQARSFNSEGEVKATHSIHLANQFSLFSREIVDLLKTWPGCKMPFNKFIPAFHHYFGRQCRVADYGYTKLRDLFEAMPHVVHVLGEGSKAVITLSSRAQIRRFAADLVKVLRFEPDKQVLLSEIHTAFEAVHGRTFKISDYGVCRVVDMVEMLPENTVTSTPVSEKLCGISKIGAENDVLIALPRKEKTFQAEDRTQQFAKEVIDLLKHAPDCTIHFNKFIPAFHHHFGVQCRVSDYGFEKLIDLFEAIPKIVDISEDADGERLVQLTHTVRLQVLGEQLQRLIEKAKDKELEFGDICQRFGEEFGFQLRPDMFKQEDIHQLLDLVQDYVTIKSEGGRNFIVISEKGYLARVSREITSLLYRGDSAGMELNKLLLEYEKMFGCCLELEEVKDKLQDVVNIKDGKIFLTYKATTIKHMEKILQDGRLTLPELESDLESNFSKLSLTDVGYSDLPSFLSSIPSLSVRGQGSKLTVGLQEYRDSPSLSKLCKSKNPEFQGPRRYVMNTPSPEKAIIPPTPPEAWMKGNFYNMPPPSSHFAPPPLRNCPTPPQFSRVMTTPPPSLINPCTPPPPPQAWSQNTSTPIRRDYIQRGYYNRMDLPGHYQDCFKPSFNQCMQGSEPMTPPGSRVNFYAQYQYQMSPLSRAPPFGSTQFYQINSNRLKDLDRMNVNNNYQQQGYNNYKQQGFRQGEISDGYPSQSFFSHSFSVPIPTRSSAHQVSFPAGSPLSPVPGFYHIPPINTNSPDSGLGDYSALKSLGDSLRIQDDGGI